MSSVRGLAPDVPAATESFMVRRPLWLTPRARVDTRFHKPWTIRTDHRPSSHSPSKPGEGEDPRSGVFASVIPREATDSQVIVGNEMWEVEIWFPFRHCPRDDRADLDKSILRRTTEKVLAAPISSSRAIFDKGGEKDGQGEESQKS